MTSSERAEQIRGKALKAVADRITELGAEFHPAAIPIVAANVAMHVMADELLDDMRVPDALVVGHVARLTAWGPGERQAEPRVGGELVTLPGAGGPDDIVVLDADQHEWCLMHRRLATHRVGSGLPLCGECADIWVAQSMMEKPGEWA